MCSCIECIGDQPEPSLAEQLSSVWLNCHEDAQAWNLVTSMATHLKCNPHDLFNCLTNITCFQQEDQP